MLENDTMFTIKRRVVLYKTTRRFFKTTCWMKTSLCKMLCEEATFLCSVMKGAIKKWLLFLWTSNTLRTLDAMYILLLNS